MNIFKPTYLYIKQHSVTGKLYFGKTVNHDIEKYKGSGKHWTNHIKKHGKEYVINLWYCVFYDKEDCIQFAANFSEEQNIVESKEWLNQVPENGTDGGIPPNMKGTKQSDEHKRRIGIANSKPRPSIIGSDNPNFGNGDKILGINNPNAKEYIITDCINNTSIIIRSLITFCRDNNLSYNRMRHTMISNKPFNGCNYKVTLC